MNFGYIRTAAVAPDLKVADCKYNTDRIIELVKEAIEQNVQLIAFPELCITSYTCGDLFHQDLLLKSAEEQLNRLLTSTKNTKIIVVVGMPVKLDNKIFNCGIVVQNGKILAVIPKTYIPNHSEFYEKRWFVSSIDAAKDSVYLCNQEVPFGIDILIRAGELCFGVEICEDIWAPIPPSSYHCIYGANLIINLSASNEIVSKSDFRRGMIQQQSAKCICAYIYVSCGEGESTTDVVFSGHSMIAESGTILAETERFHNTGKLIISDIDIEALVKSRQKTTSFIGMLESSKNFIRGYRIIDCSLSEIKLSNLHRDINPLPFVPKNDTKREKRCKEIFSIQIAGLAKRFTHTGLKTAVIGVSGGLDSTLALLVIVKTFDKLNIPRKNILGITMPGFGTTKRTYKNALQLMKSLGVSIKEIDIKDACLLHFKNIEHDPAVHDITYENVQARERTQILMDIANKHNGLVIGTGDLSELALGWATYNGDHMSMYAVNSGVPKTLIAYLVRWASENLVDEETKNTLLDILDTPVSPELLPANEEGQIKQKTEDIVGPYELHDFFLYYMVRFGFEPSKIIFLAEIAFKGKYSREVIQKWLKTFYQRFFSQQFKRSCLPDGPKVGSINLSPRGDWRMPSDASYRLWLEQLE